MSAQLLAEILDLAGVTSKGWTVLSVEKEGWSNILHDLELELEQAEDLHPVRTVDGSAGDIIDALTKGPPTGTVLLLLPPNVSDDAIAALDAGRGRLVPGPRVVVLTTTDGAVDLARFAPNLWSWVGARHHGAAAGRPRIDREARLQSLREATSWTDEQVRRAHANGKLAAEPIFAEWIALLGSVQD